ncbi:hypothetical protein Vadar_030110 [Vaccinium darrowii]|uniref:Uncharacterized protein n=1 Tax=Vaccinium darrowii TaxID=229202 RepID=A0ACB7YR80_9ERIC|nr:hypothetical protein Vadar_030110 [Vaccinium darrowii]
MCCLREGKQTDEYICEVNRLWCYDFMEEACELILKKLPAMQKRSECPEECIEAVGSLVFASAKFSDFPELRELTNVFTEKYGSSLQRFVNQEFVEKLVPKPPTIERKIKALEDIASEFSIKWDSKDVSQKIFNPSASLDSGGFEQKISNPSASLNSRGSSAKNPNPSASSDSEGFEQKISTPSASLNSRDSSQKIPNSSASLDSCGFEQRIANPAASALGQTKRFALIHDNDLKEKSPEEETVTIVYKRSYSVKERNENGSENYKPNKGREVNKLIEDLGRRNFRGEELNGNEQSSPERDNYAITARQSIPDRVNYGGTTRLGRKFTLHNCELWSSTVKEESGAKSVGKRTEFGNGTYMRSTTIT